MREIIFTLLEALALVSLVDFYIFLQGWRATLIRWLPSLSRSSAPHGVSAARISPSIPFRCSGSCSPSVWWSIRMWSSKREDIVEKACRCAMPPAESDGRGGLLVRSLLLRLFSRPSSPTIFMLGITGRLYQQFAVTIAISVLFSAFNALFSRARRSPLLLLSPKRRAVVLLRRSSMDSIVPSKRSRTGTSTSPLCCCVKLL